MLIPILVTYARYYGWVTYSNHYIALLIISKDLLNQELIHCRLHRNQGEERGRKLHCIVDKFKRSIKSKSHSTTEEIKEDRGRKLFYKAHN